MKLLFLLCCFLLPMSILAQETGGTTEESKSTIDYGFFGHPLLEKYGYKAEAGAFHAGIAGNGSMQNLPNLVDDDPTNAANSFNLVDLTVAVDQLFVVKPNPSSNITPKTYKTGTKVGITLSKSGAGVDVLGLDVIELFCIYFYKGDEVVATVEGKNGALNVLNLGLVNVDVDKTTQKITAVCPQKDGKDVEFDGIGFGTAGVQVNVADEININYVFIDDFVEVPLIKKYYPTLTADAQGMQTGAQNLINNKLSDGCTTAILNIGGAYYDVVNHDPEPFPAGIEVGFTMTSGSALDLNLGKATRIMALTYPKNADGSYNFNGELEYADITAQVNVVGLELIGGGKSAVTMMPTVPFFGLRLERISVADVDLGATVVHYAYVKLPETEMPKTKLPFELTMDIVPHCEFIEGDASITKHNGHNNYTDNIYFSTVESNPIYTKDKATGTSYWRHGIPVIGMVSHDYIKLPLTRKLIYKNAASDGENKIIAYLILVDKGSGKYELIFDNVSGSGIADGYSKCTKYTTDDEGINFSVDSETGIISFKGLRFTEEALDATFDFDSENNNPDSEFATACDCTLYAFNATDDISEKNLSAGYELSFDHVTVPSILPEYEMAGPYSRDYIESADGKKPSIEVNTHKDYLIVTMPDNVGWKTQIKSFDIYKHENKKLTKEYEFIRNSEGKWITNGLTVDVISENGVSKLIITNDATPGEYKYSVNCHTLLTDGFVKQLKEVHGDQSYETNATYGWYPNTVPTFTTPSFGEASIDASKTNGDSPLFIHELTCDLNLNDAAKGHKSFIESETPAILYNQWVSIAPETARAAAMQNERTINLNNATTDNYSISGQYSPNRDVYTLKNTDSFNGLNDKYTYSTTTRAYIPVVPTGFEKVSTPTYLVAESKAEKYFDDIKLSGIESVETDENAAVEYYNLQGIKVDAPTPGIYIMRQGSTTRKVIVK